jgi:hypothetical protein
MIMLAYQTPLGLAFYVSGSGLAGEPQYTLGRRTLSHREVVALSQRRNRRGRRVPERKEETNANNRDLQRAGCMPEVFGLEADRERRRTGDASRARPTYAHRLNQALAGLQGAWDARRDGPPGRLCCVDEFAPDDAGACSEYRDALDTAILAVLAAWKEM